MEIVRICPGCGAENLDDYVETVFPFCERCNREFYWDDIITEEEIALARRNGSSLALSVVSRQR